MVSSRGRSPRTDRSSRRRQEIVDAARRVFEERGYLETTVADIVDSIGVTRGTFYTYFASKDEVLQVLVEDMSDALFAVSIHPDRHYETPYFALEATIRQFVQGYREWAALMRNLEQAVAYNSDFLAVRQEIRRRFSDRLESVIRRHQSRTPDPDGLNPNIAAYALGGMVDDFVHGAYLLTQSEPTEEEIVTLSIIWARAIRLPVDPKAAKSPASRSRSRRQPSKVVGSLMEADSAGG
jgi:AcrR family transcriptional regulator